MIPLESNLEGSTNGQAPEPACIFGVCTCGEGFTFNGQSCEKEANPPHAETCQADADCQMHEECSYNRWQYSLYVYYLSFDIFLFIEIMLNNHAF